MSGVKVLVTSFPAWSHTFRVLRVARALAEAGADVTFCSAERYLAPARAMGLDAHPIGLDEFDAETDGWVTRAAEQSYRDLLAFYARRSPAQLIVRDMSERGASLLADRLGIPCVTVAGTATSSLVQDYSESHWLNSVRRSCGLPSVQTNAELTPYLHLCFGPAQFYSDAHPIIPTTQFVRQINDDASDPDWLTTRWPDRDRRRPLVLVAIGTWLSEHSLLADRILSSLVNRPFDVLAINTPGTADRVQDNICCTVGHAPQQSILETTDAVVTHAGINTIMESVVTKTPMVLTPAVFDQFFATTRCIDLSLGLTAWTGEYVFEHQDQDPTTDWEILPELVECVLAEKTFRNASARLAAANDELPAMHPLCARMLAIGA